MKNFKKSLALLLALVMVMAVFAACGKKSAESDVKAAADGFLSSITSLDFAGAAKYMDRDSAVYDDYFEDILSGFNLDLSDIEQGFDFRDYMYDLFAESFGDLDFLTDDIESFVDSFVALMLKKFSYEIKDIDVDGDKATVSVSITIPDMEAVDFEAISENAAEAIDLDKGTIGEDFINYVLDDLGTDDVAAIADISEDAALRYLTDFIKDSGILSGIFDYMLGEIEGQLETYTDDGNLELELKDGEWLIVDSD